MFFWTGMFFLSRISLPSPEFSSLTPCFTKKEVVHLIERNLYDPN